MAPGVTATKEPVIHVKITFWGKATGDFDDGSFFVRQVAAPRARY